jgi:dethiobiotin synthetase
MQIEFRVIGEAFKRLSSRYDFIIVEGAGGLMVPLVERLLIADLVKYLSLPLLVIARPNLGTVNQTLLTCFVARQLEITVSGVIINDYPEQPGIAEQSAPTLIESLAGAPLLGIFPHQEGSGPREIVAGLATQLAVNPATLVILRGIGVS